MTRLRHVLSGVAARPGADSGPDRTEVELTEKELPERLTAQRLAA
jgi:hypothetical protein